jgi:hypothetical protein
MSAHSTVMRRPCDNCDKYFLPDTGFGNVCPVCKKKSLDKRIKKIKNTRMINNYGKAI